MSIEVEVKLKIHDKEQLENHLKQQGFTARQTGSGNGYILYCSAP